MAASEQGDEHALLIAVDNAKRHTVAAACQECRRRKTKCDGKREVCTRCEQRGATCIYLVEGDETQRQGAKRKHNEIVSVNEDYVKLHRLIASTDDQVAAEIFTRIRARQSAHSILDALQHGSFVSSYDRAARHQLTLSLFQSSASLFEILRISNGHTSTSHASLSKRPLLVSAPDSKAGASSDEPPIRVPSSPWTTLASSDLASQLVSVYFRHLNPTFPSVDEETFVAAMRSRKLDSGYCSPFLVHCIFAFAATYVEAEEAFDEPGEMLTRGDRFYREALRLWNNEPDRVALPYLQGLMVLVMAAGCRGRDRDGLHFLSNAIQLGKNLELPMFTRQRSLQLRYDPVRSASIPRPQLLASAALLISEMTFAGALMRLPRVPEPCSEELEVLRTALPPSPQPWTHYPLGGIPCHFDINAQVFARWELVRLVYQSNQLLLHRKPPLTSSQLWTASEEWEQKFVAWFDSLPTSLQYSKDMPIPLYDLHDHYLTHLLQLHITVKNQLDAAPFAYERDVRNEQEAVQSEFAFRLRQSSYKATLVACKIAGLSKDCRETYGLRIVTPYIMQAAAIASLTLLVSLKDPTPLNEAQHEPALSNNERLTVKDVESAFEEVFRCLVTDGLQHLFSRATARMVIGTVQALNVRLPDSILRMMELVVDMAWQQQDRLKISSVYPNIAVAADLTNTDHHMDEMLRKYDALDVRDDGARARES